MPDLLAKGVAVTVAFLLVAVCAILVITSRPSTSGTQVRAEFDDAFPLIEGMYVRVDGANAGSVGKIEVNDEGNADVTLHLNDSIEPPMADATAAIRQQDTTGDSYVVFDPGGETTDEPLGEHGIVCETYDECNQTLVAPRLDDLLNAFGPAERTGVQLILVELSKALDRRGEDLNGAALTLRPALESANEALGEVEQQNSALKSLIKSAENVTGQAAKRNRELDRLTESLAVTLTSAAAQSAPLDAGLDRLPETAAQARSTLANLTSSAIAARPLAEEVASGAPQLATAVGRLPGFLDNADGFINDTVPTLQLTRKLFKAAEPTLKIGNKRVITGPFDLTGATADLLNAVLGGKDAFPALFGDDSYGVGEGTLGKRGFGSVAVEPGDLPGYPASHFDRNWLRVSAVINCEVFGVPVEPGCLLDALTAARSRDASTTALSEQAKAAAAARAGLGSGDSSSGASGPGNPGVSDSPGNGSGAPGSLPDLGLPGQGSKGDGDGKGGSNGKSLGDGLLGLAGKAKPGKAKGGKGKNKNKGKLPGGLDDLFDYLLGNG